MARVGMSAPWVVFYREIEALFAKDPGVRVIYDEDENTVNLYVEDADKAEALNKILPVDKEYGNVTLKINVIPANLKFGEVDGNVFELAFKGNPALGYIRTIRGIFTNELTYVVFQKSVVQYYTDDLGDIHGIASTLYQNIAKDVFGEKEGVFYCTDIEDPSSDLLGSPLGEWP